MMNNNNVRRASLLAIASLAMLSSSVLGYQVSVDTYVCNAGRQITVPVALDSAAGLSYAGATLTYDPQVLVVTKAEAGTLKTLMAEDFVATDTNGTLTVAIFGSTAENVASGSGSIANVTFAVRDGTAGLYSDIAVTDVQLGEKTGVKDVTVGNPVKTVNGMIRVMGAGADVARLEAPETICDATTFGTLELKEGDAILANAAQTTPISVSGAVSASSGAIPVKAPIYGWTSGTYALLSTTTTGLQFSLDGADAEFSSTVVNGVTTYYATVSVAGEIVIVCESEPLDSGVKAQIRDYASQAIANLPADSPVRAKFVPGATVKVKGPASTSVALISDMGLAPAFSIDEAGTLNFTYAEPRLVITSFDSATGAVGIKVTPGEGNSIVANINTGYVHVYGTDRLGRKMKYISAVGFDMSKYLKADTKGEGVLEGRGRSERDSRNAHIPQGQDRIGGAQRRRRRGLDCCYSEFDGDMR